MIDPLKVLKHWADVTQYDPEQKKFNILSSTYEFHRVGDRIKQLLQFDSSGMFALLYAKCSFETIAKNMKCSLIDVCKWPDMVKEYQDLWAEFCSQEMMDFEKSAIQNIVKVTSLRPSLGEADIEKEIDQFRDSIEYVAEELIGCHTEIYSGENIDTRLPDEIHIYKTLHVFNTTSECVLNLEQAPDGMYFCYITEFDSCGGYFGYFIKCGEVLFSLNDRIGERFVGEHTRSRNNRFIENKKWHIFPYKDIVSLEGSDYKGYAKSLVCEVKPYNICEFSSSSVYSIMLSICLVLSKYSGRTMNSILHDEKADVVFIDSLLPNNADSTEVQALVPVSNQSLILKKHKYHLDISISSEDVASNEYQKVFNHSDNSDKDWRECGTYTDIKSDLVREYGSDFQLVPNIILRRTWPQLTSGSSEKDASDIVVSEYIGTEGQLKLEYYRQSRQQLRDHICGKLKEDAVEAGGTTGVREWFDSCIRKNIDYFKEKAVLWYAGYTQNDETKNQILDCFSVPCTREETITFIEGEHGWESWGAHRHSILNSVKTFRLSSWGSLTDDPLTYKCIGSESTANMWFIFRPSVAENLQMYVGNNTTIPRVLKHWSYCTQDDWGAGNNLISSCDPVGFIKNPFAHMTMYERKEQHFEDFDDIDFSVTIGFSKRELNKLVNQHKKKIVK